MVYPILEFREEKQTFAKVEGGNSVSLVLLLQKICKIDQKNKCAKLDYKKMCCWQWEADTPKTIVFQVDDFQKK